MFSMFNTKNSQSTVLTAHTYRQDTIPQSGSLPIQVEPCNLPVVSIKPSIGVSGDYLITRIAVQGCRKGMNNEPHLPANTRSHSKGTHPPTHAAFKQAGS